MSATQTETVTLTSVETELHYFKPLSDEPAYTYTYEHEPQRNYSEDAKPGRVYDIRGHEEEFSLDKNGFQIYHYESKEKDFTDEEKIKTEYYAEVEDLLKKAVGAFKVIIFDHTIRRHVYGQPDTRLNRGPVQRVHVDQSLWAGFERV